MRFSLGIPFFGIDDVLVNFLVIRKQKNQIVLYYLSFVEKFIVIFELLEAVFAKDPDSTFSDENTSIISPKRFKFKMFF